MTHSLQGRESKIKNPLESVAGTAALGLALTLLLYLALGALFPAETGGAAVPAIARWMHFLFGIAWVGLLIYFNLVQMPALKAAAADGTAEGITRHVAPRALFVFRWAAVATWLTGAALLGGHLPAAFMLQAPYVPIGIGAWLGTIMLFNVWALIWPNQQKILGLRPASDEEKAKARRVAMLVSRTNLALAFPLLFFMAGGLSHRALFGL